jgi:hypothetical protein
MLQVLSRQEPAGERGRGVLKAVGSENFIVEQINLMPLQTRAVKEQ